MKRFLIIFNIFLFLFLATSISEAANPVNGYLFYGQGCPHCEDEQVFLESIEDKYSDFEIKSFEIYHNQDNYLILKKITETIEISSGGVPLLIIGDEYFVGYSKTITPKLIENKINKCLINLCPDPVSEILNNEEKSIPPQEKEKPDLPVGKIDKQSLEDGPKEEESQKITLPILGEVDIRNFSLPILTLVMGFLDGFNPCAMWVLLFLITLLFGMKNKKRLWLFGIVFLVASAFIYFLFMSAWLNLFIFLGFIFWIRIIIGGVALISGYLNLKEYITNPAGGCKITGEKKRQKVFEYLKKIVLQKHLFIALLGLILLAFAVNLVELVCSLGLPAVYVQILSLGDLSSWQYYLYLIFYVFVFILPATIVFFASAMTLHFTGISTKYSRKIHLISGIIMLIIGILMIFKPEFLMFG